MAAQRSVARVNEYNNTKTHTVYIVNSGATSLMADGSSKSPNRETHVSATFYTDITAVQVGIAHVDFARMINV